MFIPQVKAGWVDMQCEGCLLPRFILSHEGESHCPQMEVCADTGPDLGADGQVAECFMAPKGNPTPKVLTPHSSHPSNPDLLHVSAPLPILDISYKWNLIIHAFCICSHIFVWFYLKWNFCYLKGKYFPLHEKTQFENKQPKTYHYYFFFFRFYKG